jgi:hypothetical protein
VVPATQSVASYAIFFLPASQDRDKHLNYNNSKVILHPLTKPVFEKLLQ